ncbi:MAG: hypothetical protein ACREJC_13765 [Tepidisphaeraceae bacterium]
MLKSRILLGPLVLLLSRAFANADVAFDNFGPNNTYHNYGTWTGYLSPLGWSIDGTSIVPSITGKLDRLTLGMTTSSSNNEFNLTLYEDNADQPGDSFWTRTFTGMLGSYGSVVVLGSLDGPILQSNQKYWLVATVNDTVTSHSWWAGISTPINETARMNSFSGGNWWIYHNVEGWATRVELIVPEPSLLITGLSVIPFVFRRARRSSKRGSISPNRLP